MFVFYMAEMGTNITQKHWFNQ